jgi:hypothetical protein
MKMNIRSKVYLSGPMTGIKDKNFPAFNRASKALRKKGYQVINPAELDMQHPRQTWAECLRRDIVAEMRCNGVATLAGWRRSRGAHLEVYIAETLNWQVHTVAYWLKMRK